MSFSTYCRSIRLITFLENVIPSKLLPAYAIGMFHLFVYNFVNYHLYLKTDKYAKSVPISVLRVRVQELYMYANNLSKEQISIN